MLSSQNVWINEGDVHLSHIHFSIINVFHPNDVIDTECVDRRCSVLFLYQHIEVQLLLVLRPFSKMLFLQNVWIGEEGVWLSLFTHTHINPD